MFLKISLFIVCTVFIFCESSFVDTLGKCKINDGDCEKDLLQSVLRDISKTGVPELDIPQIDPMILKNISLSILNLVDFTLIQGTAKGAKDCVVTRFQTNIEDERAFIETECDLSIKGRYKVFSNSPVVKGFTGGETLTGEGNGKVKIKKLKLKLDFDFYIQRKDGELYIKCKTDKVKYTMDIGNMIFFADNFYIGENESSKLVTGLLNENWRTLMNSFGKPVMDKSIKILIGFLKKFFSAVPTKYYISDDLSNYARDD